MKAQIISIGTELLIGDTVNTNAGWLGGFLTDHGVDVQRVQVVGDDLESVKEAFSGSIGVVDLIISTGGLGPTHDDVTKQTLAELFDVDMRLDESVLEFIKKVFKKRNIPFSLSNYHQAEVPENCEVLFNTQGTAPGMWFEEEGSCIAVLPGVPAEMKHLMKEKVWPKIEERLAEPKHRLTRYIVTAGIGESTLSDEVIGDLSGLLNEGVSVAYLPDPMGAKIRITTSAGSRAGAEDAMEEVAGHIYSRAGDMIIGEGKDCTPGEATGKALRERGLTIAVAESCTGGHLADHITNIPGSSDYFNGGMVAYDNSVKINMLGISGETIKVHGAVSRQVALQMAEGVARTLNADIGISTTGIAGPGGGTDEKPVGTIWIGYWSEEQHFALQGLFTNDRLINKERGTAVALEMVRRALKQIDSMPYGLQPHFA